MPYEEGSLGPPLGISDLNQESPVTLVNLARGTQDECWVIKSGVYDLDGVPAIDVAATDLPNTEVFAIRLRDMGLAQDRFGKVATHLKVFAHPNPCPICRRSL